MIKWNKLGRFSAYARAESHLLQHTASGAIGALRWSAALCGSVCLQCSIWVIWLEQRASSQTCSGCVCCTQVCVVWWPAVTVIGVITALVLFASELREQLTPYVVQKVRGVPSSSCFSTSPGAHACAPCADECGCLATAVHQGQLQPHLPGAALPRHALRVPSWVPASATCLRRLAALGVLPHYFLLVPSFQTQHQSTKPCRHAKQLAAVVLRWS